MISDNHSKNSKDSKMLRSSIIVAIIAGVVASLCCVAPLVLLMLGISGAWISTLTRFEVIRPIAIFITLIFLGLAFWHLYLKPTSCATDQSCAKPNLRRLQRVIFWVVTILLIGLLSFPWWAPLFY